jgi:hypothetical protein
MNNALIIEEQIHQKQKPQEQLHLSPPSTPLPPELKISYWADPSDYFIYLPDIYKIADSFHMFVS